MAALCLGVSALPTLAAGPVPQPTVKPGLLDVALPTVKPQTKAAPPAAAPGQIAARAQAAPAKPLVAQAAPAKPVVPQAAPAKPLVQKAAAASFTPAPAAPGVRKPTPQQSRAQRWTCVKYVQSYGSVALRGDGWQWWDHAAGVYDRGHTPKPGSVMVLKRTSHLRAGHVAIVTKVIDKRTVLVDHANWGWNRETRGKVHLGMKVVDVSPKNDWSQTRFWFEPGNTLGSRTYPTYGFIYAPRAVRPGLPETRGVRG